jgi:hypothetical protein
MKAWPTVAVALLWASALVVHPVMAQEIELTAANGTPVQWSSWVVDNGPAAILFWASWTPDADQVLSRLGAFERTARGQQLGFVVISVQEEYDAARAALDENGTWLHDRHGRLLRQLRVLEVPSLVVIAADGQVLSRLEPSPDALGRWRAE